ncbi:MAG TPA: FkbM family methyltransferase [Burkholderiales bacterium]|nr:FkbM family methyltransferase [Burkholderiales bacterium]
MPNYYSQHGEDILLDRIFDGSKDGFFVEVGCIDGVRFSNTLTFEERGWKGLCVEAHGDFIEILRKNRPRSIIEHCAAGDMDEEGVTFYANYRGSLSSLDRTQEKRFRMYGKYFGGFTQQQVSKRRLDTILANHGVNRVDLLSLDIEGSEEQAIRGFDIKRYHPSVMVVEVDGREQETALDQLILPHGYVKWIRLGPNLFYLADISLSESVRDRVVQGDVIRAADEVAGTGAGFITVTIDTRVPLGGDALFSCTPASPDTRHKGWITRLIGKLRQ